MSGFWEQLMNAVVKAPGEAPPKGGVMPSPLESRGRIGPRPKSSATMKTITERTPEVPAPYPRIRRPEVAVLPKTVPGTLSRSEPPARTAPGGGGAAYWEENHR